MATTIERTKTPEVSWQPWSDTFPWNGRLAQMLDSFWPAGSGADFAPSDVFAETDKEFSIELDLPGIAKDDVSIDVTGRRVTINGTRKEKEHDGVLRRSTRVTGTFQYDLTLPTPVDENSVSAQLKDGVLTVHLPKAGEQASKHIQIR